MSNKVRVVVVGKDKTLMINETLLTPQYMKRHGLVRAATQPEVEKFAAPKVVDAPSATATETPTKGELLDGLLVDGKITVLELANWIGKCNDASHVAIVAEGDERKTVINAAKKRTKELKG